VRVPRFVSVVVPSYDAGPELRDQLAALEGQDYEADFEVIVADNGSSDPRRGAARTWADPRTTVRFIDARARRGPGAARNAGVRSARGDFFAFCDADDMVSPEWLRQLIETAADADLVGGRIESARLNSPLACACYDVTDPGAAHLDFLPTAAGANLGIWADVLAALGGFDERSSAGEDVALVWNAQLRGYQYRASPAIVHKRLPRRPREAARRFFRYGMGDAWLYRHFADSGMPRRDRAAASQLGISLLNGFSTVPPEARWCRWRLTFFLTCGRLAGSARNRVFFL
jgi:glycosyltransferase involved in cell wall biosynthesis